MASSTTAWARWNSSAAAVSWSVLVMNAWCRQSGHICCWVPWGESGAAHHEANGALGFAAAGDVLGLGDLGAAALGVGDVGPGVVADRLDRCAHSGSERDGDRPLDVVGVEAVDQLVGPEPRVGAYGGRPGGPGAVAGWRRARSTNRTTPRAEPAEPLRMRAASTSRVSARAASSG